MESYQGTVIKSTGSAYLVALNDSRVEECRLKGTFRIKGLKATNPVVVGDRVEIKQAKPNEPFFITKLFERKNYIIRRATKLSKVSHILAANIDQAVIVVTLTQPKTKPGFIDRFLVTAEAYRIPAILVFNKIDLYSEDIKQIQEKFLNIYQRDAGYKCFQVSALSHYGLDEFIDLLKNKNTLLTGHSGVGKSALINAIQPGLNLKTGRISDYHKQGKHTTTFAEMHPLTFGGYIIDTPGIREFALIDLKPDELTHFFPEFFRLLPQCQFYNCTHVHEPGCAVKQAIENQQLNPYRYKSYLAMLQGNDIMTEEWELE